MDHRGGPGAFGGQFLAGGHPDLLDPSTLARDDALPVAGADYGLGLRLLPTPAACWSGHTGSMPGFLAALFVDPGTAIGATVLTNATTGIDTERAGHGR